MRRNDLETREADLLLADLDDLVWQLSKLDRMDISSFCHWTKKSGYNALLKELHRRLTDDCIQQKGGEEHDD